MKAPETPPNVLRLRRGAFGGAPRPFGPEIRPLGPPFPKINKNITQPKMLGTVPTNPYTTIPNDCEPASTCPNDGPELRNYGTPVCVKQPSYVAKPYKSTGLTAVIRTHTHTGSSEGEGGRTGSLAPRRPERSSAGPRCAPMFTPKLVKCIVY